MTIKIRTHWQTTKWNCVLIDTNGEMWVGTMNGLCKYNAEEDAFETLPLEIPSHNICSIIEDQRILWLTTTKGLVRYTPGEGCPSIY